MSSQKLTTIKIPVSYRDWYEQYYPDDVPFPEWVRSVIRDKVDFLKKN